MKLIQKYQTDWINTTPVFYNTNTKQISLNMNDVIDWNNFEFDSEGLYNYLFFGYQVFEQTQVKNVKFLRHSSIITQYQDSNNELKYEIQVLDDPIEEYIGKKSTSDEVIDKLQKHVQAFEQNVCKLQSNKRFLLPLSGGYDSRLIATLIEDKSRIDAFTFDISLSEKYSFESKYAQEICRLLEINWQSIYLNQYWNDLYTRKNFEAFCLEMPSQASYHMEMYEKIIQEHGNQYIALSGSVGDWWRSQKVPLSVPNNFHCFDSLFFNHGISIPAEYIQVQTDHDIKKTIYDKNIKRLKEDDLFKIVFARRGRIGLASFIYRTASLYFDTYTPFYDIEIAMSQLNLHTDHVFNQAWIKDFFSNNKLNVEQKNHKQFAMSNDFGLDIKTVYYSIKKEDLLHPHYFKGIINPQRVEWINYQLSKAKNIPFPLLSLISRMFFGVDKLASNISLRTIFGKGFDYTYCRAFKTNDIFKAISEWSVLKPIEIAMIKAHKL